MSGFSWHTTGNLLMFAEAWLLYTIGYYTEKWLRPTCMVEANTLDSITEVFSLCLLNISTGVWGSHF